LREVRTSGSHRVEFYPALVQTASKSVGVHLRKAGLATCVRSSQTESRVHAGRDVCNPCAARTAARRYEIETNAQRATLQSRRLSTAHAQAHLAEQVGRPS